MSWSHTDFRIEPLSSTHDRASFSCGIAALDHYLHKQAGQDVEKRVAICFVLTPDGRTVAGFYTLSQYAVDLHASPPEIARKLPKYPEVPATLIGRLAIGEGFQGHKLGEFLLLDALHRALRQSKEVASTAVIVDAKNEAARRFYKRYDFRSLPDIPNRMFLPMKTIERPFRERG
jgi:ribosomal protein S18 acetylase RimI-like enzyme